MTVAIVGNMNNNGYAILRFLTSKGIDAHLFLTSHDVLGSSKHFRPELDEGDTSTYARLISPCGVTFGYADASSGALKLLTHIAYRIFQLTNSHRAHFWRPTPRRVLEKFETMLQEYDALIVSGLVPSVLDESLLKKAIFFPVSIRVEYLLEPEFRAYRRSRNPFKRWLYANVAAKVKRKLQLVKMSICIDDITLTVLRRIGVRTNKVIPPIFHSDTEKRNRVSISRDLPRDFASASFKIFAPSRHLWVNPGYSDRDWDEISKRTNLIIDGFKYFSERAEGCEPALLMIRYGKDWQHTERYAREVGLSKQVHWIDVTPRRDLVQIYRIADVVIGEFYKHNTAPGGVGIEALTLGKPFVNGGKSIDEGQRQETMPYARANSADEIGCVLLSLQDPGQRRKAGEKGTAWVKKSYDRFETLIRGASTDEY